MLMRWLKMCLAFMGVATLGLASLPLHAQEELPTPPLIYGSGGDIWTYDIATGETTNITVYGYNEEPILNEATGLVAYNSYARLWVDSLNTGTTPSGSTPSNIWVIDPTTGDAFRVIDQPENASLENRIFVSRSDPTWSPDGTHLAWGEYHSNGMDEKDTYSVGIYDIESQTTTDFPLPDLEYYGVPGPFPVLWSPDGQFIAVIFDVLDTSGSTRVVDFYDPTMTLLTEAILPNDTISNSVLWVYESGKPKLGFYLGEGEWLTVNPADGEVLTAMMELRGEVQDDNLDKTGIFLQNEVWYMVFPAASTQEIRAVYPGENFDGIALDPLGQYVAYVDENSILQVMSGRSIIDSVEAPDGITSLAWSNLVWSLSDSATPLND
jgi:hypothetical protein